MHNKFFCLFGLLLLNLAAAAQEPVVLPHVFAPGDRAQASQVNQNFAALLAEIETLRSEVAALNAPSEIQTPTLVDANGLSIDLAAAPRLGRAEVIIESGSETYTADLCVDASAPDYGGDCEEGTGAFGTTPIRYNGSNCTGIPYYESEVYYQNRFPYQYYSGDYFMGSPDFTETADGSITFNNPVSVLVETTNDRLTANYGGGPLRSIYWTVPLIELGSHIKLIVAGTGVAYMMARPIKMTLGSTLMPDGRCYAWNELRPTNEAAGVVACPSGSILAPDNRCVLEVTYTGFQSADGQEVVCSRGPSDTVIDAANLVCQSNPPTGFGFELQLAPVALPTLVPPFTIQYP